MGTWNYIFLDCEKIDNFLIWKSYAGKLSESTDLVIAQLLIPILLWCNNYIFLKKDANFECAYFMGKYVDSGRMSNSKI